MFLMLIYSKKFLTHNISYICTCLAFRRGAVHIVIATDVASRGLGMCRVYDCVYESRERRERASEQSTSTRQYVLRALCAGANAHG